jgi:hypothetical protein
LFLFDAKGFLLIRYVIWLPDSSLKITIWLRVWQKVQFFQSDRTVKYGKEIAVVEVRRP